MQKYHRTARAFKALLSGHSIAISSFSRPHPFHLLFPVALDPGLECKSNIGGSDYRGHVAKTRSGRACQRWGSQVPHAHDVTAAMMPDRNLSAAENYCRSPGFLHDGPWCYTEDPLERWELCDVPTCGKVFHLCDG